MTEVKNTSIVNDHSISNNQNKNNSNNPRNNFQKLNNKNNNINYVGDSSFYIRYKRVLSNKR